MHIINSPSEISSLFQSALDVKQEIQCIFNKGKYVYYSKIDKIDSDFLYFDFSYIDPVEFTKHIDLYSPVVMVFFVNSLRYQFFLSDLQLVAVDGSSQLKAHLPLNVHAFPGRKNPRIDFPENFAKLMFSTDTQSFSLPIREMSLGGASCYSPIDTGIKPLLHIKQSTLHFIKQDIKIKSSLEVVRIQYSLFNPKEKKYLISFKFPSLASQEQQVLQNIFSQIKR